MYVFVSHCAVFECRRALKWLCVSMPLQTMHSLLWRSTQTMIAKPNQQFGDQHKAPRLKSMCIDCAYINARFFFQREFFVWSRMWTSEIMRALAYKHAHSFRFWLIYIFSHLFAYMNNEPIPTKVRKRSICSYIYMYYIWNHTIIFHWERKKLTSIAHERESFVSKWRQSWKTDREYKYETKTQPKKRRKEKNY